MNKSELISRMKSERQIWNDLIANIITNDHQDEIVSKNWTLKDVILHIYRYEEEIKLAIQNKSFKESNFWKLKYPKRNELIYLERDDFDINKALDTDKINFSELLATVDKLNEDEINSTSFFEGSKTTVHNLIKSNSYGHYSEHIPKLKKRFNV